MKDSKRQRIAPIQKNNHLKPNAKGAKHSEARPTAATLHSDDCACAQRRLRRLYTFTKWHTQVVCAIRTNY